MGPNLTEKALQRAARSVTAVNIISERFDAQSGVPCQSSAHTAKSDILDVKKVMAVVRKNKLLSELGNREHKNFPGISSNPLSKWDVEKTKTWIREKEKEYLKFQRKFRAHVED